MAISIYRRTRRDMCYHGPAGFDSFLVIGGMWTSPESMDTRINIIVEGEAYERETEVHEGVQGAGGSDGR